MNSSSGVISCATGEAVRDSIESMGPWFHNLHLPDGTQTCPNHWLGDFPAFKWRQLAPHLPADLKGWSCLDIGCNAGFYSFELARRGADVVGIDVDKRYLQQATWAAEQFKLSDRIKFRRQQVYDLVSDPHQYDLIFFMGVFYHLRYPMLGLDIVCQKVKKRLVFQTLTMPGDEILPPPANIGLDERKTMLEPGWPKMAFIEREFAGDPTNWWAPNRAAVEAMLRSAGMAIRSSPVHEFFICEPDPTHPSAMTTWNSAELQSATGQPRQ